MAIATMAMVAVMIKILGANTAKLYQAPGARILNGDARAHQIRNEVMRRLVPSSGFDFDGAMPAQQLWQVL